MVLNIEFTLICPMCGNEMQYNAELIADENIGDTYKYNEIQYKCIVCGTEYRYKIRTWNY